MVLCRGAANIAEGIPAFARYVEAALHLLHPEFAFRTLLELLPLDKFFKLYIILVFLI